MLNDKNSAKINKISKILIALTAILTLLYLLSFTKSCSSSYKREKVKTALVNQKYKDTIKSFELSDSSGIIEIINQGTFWSVGSVPASSERIENLIENLTKVRNLYKISDKISNNSTFGLQNGTEFHLRYYTDEGFHELIFGNQDFSLSSRYMMTEKSTQVYEVDSSLDTYLTTSIQSWAEPYIISHTASSSLDTQAISVTYKDSGGKIKTGNIKDSQKLLDLRHGGVPSESEYQLAESTTPLAVLKIENGDKSSITVNIFQTDSQANSFLVKTQYFTPDSKSAYYTSYSKISSWTYNKIKEITL